MGAVSSRNWRLRYAYPRASVETARWKNPEDAAKHPKLPAGTAGGKGGQWAPKGAALANEAQSVREALLQGAVANLRPLSVEGISGGIRESDCAIAEVGGVKAFLKRGWDAPHEYAAFVVSQMLGMDGRLPFVDVPETAFRDYDWLSRWNADKARYDVETFEGGTGKVAFAQFREGKPGVSAVHIKTRELYNLAVFDVLIGQTDRHEWNYLVAKGHVVPIDHGFAFSGGSLDWQTFGAAGNLWRHRARLGAETFFQENDMGDGPYTTLKVLPHARKALKRFVAQATTPKGKKALRVSLSEMQIGELLAAADEMLKLGSVGMIST